MGTLLRDTEVFCGVARLPKEMAAAEPSAYLAIELEVDLEISTIVDVCFTAVPTLCEHWLTTLLTGAEPVAGIADAVSTIQARYHGTGKAATLAALHNSLQQYESRTNRVAMAC